jgi:hypothetical protein
MRQTSPRLLSALWPSTGSGALPCAPARLLAGVGERLRRGDWIITGSVVQVAVRPGEEVIADFGELGRVGRRSPHRRPGAALAGSAAR